ncbi:hypothetical protein ACFSTI_11605 [Rhizorhabdus histidinilytica]
MNDIISIDPHPKMQTHRNVPPRHRFLEPIHNVKDGQGNPCAITAAFAADLMILILEISKKWWSLSGSNR